MLEIIPKTNSYIVDDDYLTPEPHCKEPINVEIVLDINQFYNSIYGWSNAFYLTTVTGICTSGSFTFDKNSDIRSTCSLEIVVNDDKWLMSNGSNVWFDKVFKIGLKYNYPNYSYPNYDWGGYSGLWNNNGFLNSDPSQINMGFFIPVANSYTYNETSKTLSISGENPIVLLMNSYGGALLKLDEDYDNYWKNNTLVLEGSSSQMLDNSINANYIDYLISQGSTDVPERWKTIIQDLYTNNAENSEAYVNPLRDSKYYSTYDIIYDLVNAYRTPMIIGSVYVNLYNDHKSLPYDLEFEADSSLYDVFKKIVDLYDNQGVFYDNNSRLTLMKYPSQWSEVSEYTNYLAREISDLVVDEKISISKENVVNYVVVFGRDNTCSGYYMIRSGFYCSECDKYYGRAAFNLINDEAYAMLPDCPICGKELANRTMENLLSVDMIGYRKKVVYSDNYTTDDECRYAAKAIAYSCNQTNETIIVTIVDRYLSMFHWATLGIGKRIEYTCKTTGETNVYILQKLSHEMSANGNCTWTLEMTPFTPIVDEDALNRPTMNCSVDSEGIVTMVISNGEHTKRSLYKIYSNNNKRFGFWSSEYAVTFLGETCKKLDSGHTAKVFKYKLPKNGIHYFHCTAYNRNCKPSVPSTSCKIEFNGYKNPLLLTDGNPILNGDYNEIIV